MYKLAWGFTNGVSPELLNIKHVLNHLTFQDVELLVHSVANTISIH